LDAKHPLLYPGAAANFVGVGVVDSVRSRDPLIEAAYFGLALPEHSSCGPAWDGRCKPDLVAPGNCLVADTAAVNAYDLPGNWSSFAAPVVAGIAGQLVQKARQEETLNLAVAPEAGGRVIKALLMNSATKLPHWHKGRISKEDDHTVPLDYAQGAGLANAVGAYRQLIAGRQEPGEVAAQGWDLNELNGTQDAAYRFEVAEPNQDRITCTVVWNRHYEDPLDLQSIEQADIRLELWAIIPEDRSLDKLVDFSDSTVDNVEHLYCRPEPGYRTYELVVRLHNDTTQPVRQPELYAVAWNMEPQPNDLSILVEDLNCDGIVNDLDIEALVAYKQAQLESDTAYAIGDLNTDGVIDEADAAMILSQRNHHSLWYVP
jgi:hypothetical protein